MHYMFNFIHHYDIIPAWHTRRQQHISDHYILFSWRKFSCIDSSQQQTA